MTGTEIAHKMENTLLLKDPYCAAVAQVVERSPEKAGVGGSTPSRGTIPLNNIASRFIAGMGGSGHDYRADPGPHYDPVSF